MLSPFTYKRRSFSIAKIHEPSNLFARVRLGNPQDPMDDLLYIILSDKTAPKIAATNYKRVKERFSTWVRLLASDPEALRRLMEPDGLSCKGVPDTGCNLLGHVIALLSLLQIKIPNATSIAATTRNLSPILPVVFREAAMTISSRISSITKKAITVTGYGWVGIKVLLKEARKATLTASERITHKAPNRKSAPALCLLCEILP